MDVSNHANQVLIGLRNAGYTAPDMLASPETITSITRLPKGRAMAGLDELVKKGYVRRIAREKSHGYFADT